MIYAFRVEPQRERTISAILKNRGFDAFVPLERRWLRRCGRRRTGIERDYPLIVGYVFVRFSRPPPWYQLFSMHCLKSVVGIGGMPMPIPETAMGALMSGQSVPHTRSTNTRLAFVPGDTVRVSHGPLAGYEGRVEAVVGKRARMIFQMLGRGSVDVPVDSLEAA